MNYKVILRYGWSANTFYYSRLDDARRVCQFCQRDGGDAVMYRRSGDGWEVIE